MLSVQNLENRQTSLDLFTQQHQLLERMRVDPEKGDKVLLPVMVESTLPQKTTVNFK